MTGSLRAHPRIVVAEVAPDDAAESVARALRDAGAEIVYTVLHDDAPRLAAAVLQEDPAAVVVPDEAAATLVRAELANRGLDDVPVITAAGTPDDVVDRVRETLERAP